MTLLLVFIVGLVIGVGVGMSLRKTPAAAPAPVATPAAKTVTPAAPAPASKAALNSKWLPGLGGADNVQQAEVIAATRVRVALKDGHRLDERALVAAGVQAVAAIDEKVFHLIVGQQAAA
ncbi:PTS transporter subunit EIIB [Chitinibacter tainanensis]|uniref:PTS transporter subunit EIIB n=1 Tax=Chitinibacter tainanensis TaxID=230667 RepID=UPI00041B2AA4|nr:PTS transporter subunit EIIB [Chitinibacter tainanensis]